MTKAAVKRPARKTPPKLDIAKAVAPVETRIATKKTRTASLSGSLMAYQQALSILSQSRSFGEAIDQLNRLEAQARTELITSIHEELKARRIKTDNVGIRTDATTEGVFIVLSTVPA